MKRVSSSKFCGKVLSMLLKSLRSFDDGVTLDVDKDRFSIYVPKAVAAVSENGEVEGRCVFDIDWNELYRSAHLERGLSAYRIGKASVDVLWQEIMAENP